MLVNCACLWGENQVKGADGYDAASATDILTVWTVLTYQTFLSTKQTNRGKLDPLLLFTADFYFCQLCGQETFDGSAKRSLLIRRKLVENNPKLAPTESTKETISLKALGGDKFLATPKKA